MDRREVDDIEAERGDVGQPRDAVVERAVPAGHRALAARHHFVPGAGARARPVDLHRGDDAAGEVAARLAGGDGGGELVGQQDFHVAGPVEVAAGAVDRPAVERILSSQLSEKFTPFTGLQRDVQARFTLEQECSTPGGELVGPGFDDEQIAARLRRCEAAMPPVVCVRLHRFGAPIGLGFPAPEQCRPQLIVPFAQPDRPIYQWVRRQSA